jgi:antitoxin component HigA of HigAB toxin-antitoxin module
MSEPSITIEIRTADEYDAAVSLIQRLSGAPEDSAEEARLRILVEAVEAWDAKHDRDAGRG